MPLSPYFAVTVGFANTHSPLPLSGLAKPKPWLSPAHLPGSRPYRADHHREKHSTSVTVIPTTPPVDPSCCWLSITFPAVGPPRRPSHTWCPTPASPPHQRVTLHPLTKKIGAVKRPLMAASIPGPPPSLLLVQRVRRCSAQTPLWRQTSIPFSPTQGPPQLFSLSHNIGFPINTAFFTVLKSPPSPAISSPHCKGSCQASHPIVESQF